MGLSDKELVAERARLLGPKFPTSYEDPVHIVKGESVWLWDAQGNKYLDCFNNVPHVGHCHPKVVEAIAKQAAVLNTNTRYLHEGIVRYIDRLLSTFAESLNTAIMTCTASEANDIALRICEVKTKQTGIIASDYTYHGNTSVVSQLSRMNKPGYGRQDHIRFVPAPDSYRPLGGISGEAHALVFAQEVQNKIEELQATEFGFSALIVCPFFANEGFPDLHNGFLEPAAQVVRAAGGLIIADEVQAGFGRIGTHFWPHERVGLVPDIVTLGKSMGNGHPVSGLVSSEELVGAFQSSVKYFNTTAGNPVSCAAAEAVLQVIEEEGLQENALIVGEYARMGLKSLAEKHECIGDIRGSGLYFGLEFVLDKDTKKPATQFTKRVVNEMRRNGVFVAPFGIYGNTIKIRPPMPFSKEDSDLMLQVLDRVLGQLDLH